MASEMDPEETEYLAHLACPTIADDSLAHQGGSDVGQGGRKYCDGLRRTPGMVVPGIWWYFLSGTRDLLRHSTDIHLCTKNGLGRTLSAHNHFRLTEHHFRNRFRVHRYFFFFFRLSVVEKLFFSNASEPLITDTHTSVGTLPQTTYSQKRTDLCVPKSTSSCALF